MQMRYFYTSPQLFIFLLTHSLTARRKEIFSEISLDVYEYPKRKIKLFFVLKSRKSVINYVNEKF